MKSNFIMIGHNSFILAEVDCGAIATIVHQSFVTLHVAFFRTVRYYVHKKFC